MAPKTFDNPNAMPATIPVFPLSGALLLPRGQMPLNIFEARYLSMIDAALAGDRIIGMVQPDWNMSHSHTPNLCKTGCAGRISAFQETGDGRYLITLIGIARFEIEEELTVMTPYRQCRISFDNYAQDFDAGAGEQSVNRDDVVKTFRSFLEANDLETDWEDVDRASNEALVNALAMMSPFGPPEKQALLEAPDLKTRAETLVAITELELVKADNDNPSLQ
jgi:Lon protease-like protein